MSCSRVLSTKEEPKALQSREEKLVEVRKALTEKKDKKDKESPGAKKAKKAKKSTKKEGADDAKGAGEATGEDDLGITDADAITLGDAQTHVSRMTQKKGDGKDDDDEKVGAPSHAVSEFDDDRKSFAKSMAKSERSKKSKKRKKQKKQSGSGSPR